MADGFQKPDRPSSQPEQSGSETRHAASKAASSVASRYEPPLPGLDDDPGGVPDQELVVRAVTGNRDAFALLVERHYDRIYRLAYGWLGDQIAAEDVAQDVVVKLATAIVKFEGRSKFTTWLHRLVLNHLHDKTRAEKRRRIEPGLVFEDLQIASDEVPADRQVAGRQAMQAVNALPAKLRAAVVLVYWQGLTHEAAGKVLGCKGGTVSWRLNEAKSRLAETLDWYEPGEGGQDKGARHR